MFLILRAISYLLAAGMGLGILLFYPANGAYPVLINQICGWLSLVFGLVCCVSTVRKHWMHEWSALFFLIFAISIYVVIAWSKLATSWTGFAGSCALSWLLVLNIFRLVELTVFFVKAVRGAKMRRRVVRRDS
jgi:peptidoglycan biosynthesis protein MviN/MurJ (putative lipid II flippase)